MKGFTLVKSHTLRGTIKCASVHFSEASVVPTTENCDIPDQTDAVKEPNLLDKLKGFNESKPKSRKYSYFCKVKFKMPAIYSGADSLGDHVHNVYICLV